MIDDDDCPVTLDPSVDGEQWPAGEWGDTDENPAGHGEATLAPGDTSSPPLPTTIEDTGLTKGFLGDLALKHIYFMGMPEAIRVADSMKLEFLIVSELLEDLKKQELIRTEGGTATLGGIGIRYAVTDRGREKIEEVLQRDNYRGPTPVPLEQYSAQLAKQSIRGHKITPERVKEVFGRLVLDPSVADKIGPAINSGRSIFLYGPPGNGKTSLAECITDTIGGQAYIPHAIVVESEVIRVFDDLYHKRLDTEVKHDKRWVLSRRPIVIAGGELSLEMLDLTWSGHTTYYEAPFQAKANSGVLVIDDFGRQRCDPKELLNRWIVPLESGYDFLTCRSGQKAKVPFDNLIVFSTNLDPKDLVDEAFLRRIRYKIEVGDPSPENFKKIFEVMCKKHSIPFDAGMVDYLIEKHYLPNNRSLRCCQPRDLIEQMVDINKYTDEMPHFTEAVIDRLCDLYFVEL